MRIKKTLTCLVAAEIVFGTGLAAIPVMADEVKKKSTEKPTNQHARTKITLEGMVVTAQKTEENVQEVPISMTVFDDIKLEDSKINDMSELTMRVPNLYAEQSQNQNKIIMRGVSSNAASLNTSVGIFVDGINYPMSFMQNPDLLDIERVEVLRGPQGTLYGRNTEVGAINIITKKPYNEFEGKVSLETGIYDTPTDNPIFTKVGASLSGPIIKDKFYIGVSLQKRDSDGYMKNELTNDKEAGKIDQLTGRVSLRWTPNEDTDILLISDNFEKDNGIGYTRYIDGVSESDRYKIKWDGPNAWKDTNNGQVLKIEHNMNDYNIVSITAHNDFKSDFENDGEFGSWINKNQFFEFETKSISQEFRISSPENNGKLKWLAGVYAFQDNNYAEADTRGRARTTDFDYEGYALFGQGTYTFNGILHLTTGLRYDYQKYEGKYKTYLSNELYSNDFNSENILPKISLAYDFNNNKMGYFTISKGLLAGGYNYAAPNADSSTMAFGPQTSWNYELGVKTSWLNNKLTLNGALFYIAIEDKQVSQWNGSTSIIANAGKAHSQGIELELNAHVNLNLNIFAGLGFVESKIDEWEYNGYDYDGKYATMAPKYNYNLGFKYSLDQGYYTIAEIIGLDDFYTDEENEQKIEGYVLVNLSFGYQGEDFDVAVWGKNIFDKEYYTNQATYWDSSTIVQDGLPRTFGITLNYYF